MRVSGMTWVVVLFTILTSTPLHAQEPPTQNPAPAEDYLIDADELNFDQPNDVVTAKGEVEISAKSSILKTEEAVVDNKNKTVRTPGPVSITQKDNTVIFARDAFLSQDLKDGFTNQPAMLMPDDTRFIAAQARRANGEYTVYNKGLFSPCNLCIDNPRKAPLWQMRAEKVTHNEVSHDLIYRDVTMEMAGIPVFYTPYFSHPDPTVKRRSGFLTPSYVNNADIGTFVRVPYYYTFSPDLDYTAAPNFSKADGIRWMGTLRSRFENGKVQIMHSFAIADRKDDDGSIKKDQLRGHLQGFVQYNIDNEYRTGADFFMLTDKNYLRRYSEGSEDVLTNRAYLERFKGRDYGALEAFYFQDNRPSSPTRNQPLVIPRLSYSALGEPNELLGGRWSYDGLLAILQRNNGANTRKLGNDIGWQRQDILPLGFKSTLTGHVRHDIFMVDNFPDVTTPTTIYNNEITHRIFPEGQALLSYPLVAELGSVTHVVEPIAAFTASPTYSNDPLIPNEDSASLNFDTTNLFSLNRYPGTDQLEQGTRLSYGVKSGFYLRQGSYAEFAFGQNYRLTRDPNIPVNSGLETDFSDYVGQMKFRAVELKFPTVLNFDYTFKLDKDAKNFRRHDINTSFGIKEFMPSFAYSFNDPVTPGLLGKVEELRFGFSSTIADYYNFSVSRVNDLRPDFAGPRSTSVSLGYSDECFRAALSYTRDHTQRTGVNSGNTFTFTLYFKGLGGFDSGSN